MRAPPQQGAITRKSRTGKLPRATRVRHEGDEPPSCRFQEHSGPDLSPALRMARYLPLRQFSLGVSPDFPSLSQGHESSLRIRSNLQSITIWPRAADGSCDTSRQHFCFGGEGAFSRPSAVRLHKALVGDCRRHRRDASGHR